MAFLPVHRQGAVQNITTSGTSAQATNAVSAGVTRLRIIATVAAWVNIGHNPTASATNSMYLPVGTVGEVFGCVPGDKIAALQVAAAGTVNITELIS